MRNLLLNIRRMFCRHTWRATRFQALVPGISQDCTKCAAQRWVYPGFEGGER